MGKSPIRPTKWGNSLYFLIPSAIADLFDIDRDSEFTFDLAELKDDGGFALVFTTCKNGEKT